MIPCSIAYGSLRLDWDHNGTLTLARTDLIQSIQLSMSEWVFLLKAADLRGWPVAPPSTIPQSPA